MQALGRDHLCFAFAAKNKHFAQVIGFVFDSFGTNNFISGIFCVFSPKGKQKQMKIQPKPNQNTSLPLTRTSSSVSSHGEEKLSNMHPFSCSSLYAQNDEKSEGYLMFSLNLIFMKHMQNPSVERASSKVM